jgi:hypothetical protein
MTDKKSKVYTSSIPDVAAKQRERAKEALREQLPMLIEVLLEDEAAMDQLSNAIAAKLAPKEEKKK